MKKCAQVMMGLLCCSAFPGTLLAQSPSDEFHGLQKVLDNLYDQMIPLCSQIIGVAQGIAAFAAIWYIGSRVWRHIANAESVDFYPLLRPFVIAFCIGFFPQVLAVINGILSPTVTATDAIVQNTNQAMQNMLNRQNQQLTTPRTTDPGEGQEDPARWYQYTHPDNPSGPTVTNPNPIEDAFSGFSIKNMIKKAIASMLELFYEAAALCIDTIRTFKLIVLAILGPLVFGLSVFDGFHHTLKAWLARYINVYMWLPVANIFGAITAKIQLNMLELTANGGSSDAWYGETNTAYLIFLLIAIVGFFTVPSIAGYIVNAGGHALFSKTAAVASVAASAFTGLASKAIMSRFSSNSSGNIISNNSTVTVKGGVSSESAASGHMEKKLSGKT